MLELLVAWGLLGIGVYEMYASWHDIPPWQAFIAKAKNPSTGLDPVAVAGAAGAAGGAIGKAPAGAEHVGDNYGSEG